MFNKNVLEVLKFKFMHKTYKKTNNKIININERNDKNVKFKSN